MSKENSNQELFFSTASGWQGREGPDSEYKLESNMVTTHNFVVENTFLKKNPRAGWDPLTPEELAQFNGVNKGYIYKTKRKNIDDREYLAVRSLRYIDELVLNEVLNGLSLLTPEGKIATEPQLLKQDFLIPLDQESVFLERVNAAGGLISETRSSLEDIYTHLQKMNELLKITTEASKKTEEIISQVSDNVMINSDSIDEYSQVISNSYRESNQLMEKINAQVSAYEDKPGDLTETGKAISYRSFTTKINDQIGKYQRLQKSFESQIATRLGEVFNDKLPSLDTPEVSRKLLFAPIVEYYLSRGFDCILENGEIKIKIKDQIITMGEKIKVTKGKETIEQEGERGAPKRTVREI